MIISLLKILLIIVLTIAVASIVIIIIPLTKSERLFHKMAKFYSRAILAVSRVKLNVEGLDKVPFSRNYIYVANHASLFDIPAAVAGIPDQIRLVYKKELEKIPFFGWGLKLSRTYISIDRLRGQEAMQSLEKAAEKIRSGVSVLLFAEGTRTNDGNLQPFKRGAFNLAVKAGVPVVPLTIKGSFHVLQKKSLRISPGTITLVLDEPIEPIATNGKSAELFLMQRVRTVIEQHLTN